MTRPQLFGAIVGATGLALIIWQAGWVLALGIVLILWGNHMEFGRRGTPWKPKWLDKL